MVILIKNNNEAYQGNLHGKERDPQEIIENQRFRNVDVSWMFNLT